MIPITEDFSTGILVYASNDFSDGESVELADAGPKFQSPEGVPAFAPERLQDLYCGNRILTPHPAMLTTPN